MAPVSNIRIGVSSCLTGEKVRYDGDHRLCRFVTEVLGTRFTLVPVCPEVEVGMPVPRETIHLEGDPATPRVVAPDSGADWTERLTDWARHRVAALATENLCGYVFKQNSPSCGVFGVKVYAAQGDYERTGRGVFAAAFTAAYPDVPVIEESALEEAAAQEEFIARVLAYHRRRAGGTA